MSQDLIKRQQSHFEGVAAQYADTRLKDSNFIHFKKLLWRYALDNLRADLQDELVVLEAMCGLCDGYLILRDNGVPIRKYYAFDYSDTMVSRAQEIMAGQAAILGLKNVSIFADDITSFSADQQFDLVILIGGLHHVYAQAEVALSRVVRSLRPGGLLINFEPTHANPLTHRIRELIYENNRFFDEQTESGFQLSSLNQILSGSGLTIQRQVYPGLLLYCLFYNPDAFRSLPAMPYKLLRFLFQIEKRLYSNRLGRFWSFATITIARRNCDS